MELFMFVNLLKGVAVSCIDCIKIGVIEQRSIQVHLFPLSFYNASSENDQHPVSKFEELFKSKA